jgi:hypothetical protein
MNNHITYRFFQKKEKEKMMKDFGKTKTASIALILILTISAIFIALPIVSAHDPPWDIPQIAYAVARPNPIGVNQEALILFWPTFYPITAVGAWGDRYTWNVEITTPSGDEVKIGPIESDPVGGGYALYTPTEVGTYTIVAIMDEHLLTGEPAVPDPTLARSSEYINDTVSSAASEPIFLVVQEDPIEGWSETPLPEEYYTRPFDGVNRDWWLITGNWLAGAAQNVGPTSGFGYGPAPESAHIMWSKPYFAGGIMDYRFGDYSFETYHYQGMTFDPPIIIYGQLIYNYRVNAHQQQGYLCVDLYTGETIYYENATTPSFGQIYNYESPNQHGGFGYLWRTSGVYLPPGNISMPGTQTWEMIDAFTGNPITTIANVSTSGTAVYSQDGSLLYYNIDENTNRLTVWNSSATPTLLRGAYGTDYWQWRPAATGARRQSVRTTNINEMVVHDGSKGFSLNVSVPDLPGGILEVRENKFIIGGTSGQNDEEAVEDGTLWAVSLEPGNEGTLLWEISFTPPRAYTTAEKAVRGRYPVGGPTVDPEDGVFLFEEPATLQRWGYDLETGDLLWGPTDPEPALNYYGMTDTIYEGKLLTCGYGGVLIAYNVTTGEKLWEYTAKGVGFESPYGNYPIGMGCIADGKIYLGSGEHSPTQPIWRGPNMRCIDANTGEEVWKILFHGVSMPSGNAGSNYAIADGYLVGLNAYDNQIYCFGKGPSKTTVDAQSASIPLGSSIVIKGTVTDESAGTKQDEQAARFPNGVPVMADEDQEDWMEYVYMQQPIPADAKGVPVSLDAIDPNGNIIHIGNPVSDLSGFYSYKWMPEIEGKYTIIATFEGSKAYYASYAETAIGVDPAPAAAQPIEPEEPAAAPLITTELAIIIAVVVIAVVGIVAYWALRKRK